MQTRNSKFLSYLIIIIYIFPFFYNYLNLLPIQAKWMFDISILIFFVNNILGKKKYRFQHTKPFNYLFFFSLSLSIIYLLSSIINESNVLLTILSIEKIFQAFLLYIIIYSFLSLDSDNSIYKVDKYFDRVIKIQVILIPIEYILYTFYKNFSDILIKNVTFNPYDIASGTFGNGSTGAVGVFCVCYFIYAYVHLKKKYSYIFLIPLLFIFSGGAIILLVIALFLIFLTSANKLVKQTIPIVLGTLTLVSVGYMASGYIFQKEFLTNSLVNVNDTLNDYIDSITNQNGYNEWEITKQGRLDRIRGFYYVNQVLNSKNQIFYGMGSSVGSSSQTLNITKSNKEQITEVNNETLFYFLQAGLSGALCFLFLNLLLIIYFFKRIFKDDLYKTGFIISVVIFISSFYIRPFQNPAVLTFFIYIYVLINILENNRRVYTNNGFKKQKMELYNNRTN